VVGRRRQQPLELGREEAYDPQRNTDRSIHRSFLKRITSMVVVDQGRA
jgi:hypothetical protein